MTDNDNGYGMIRAYLNLLRDKQPVLYDLDADQLDIIGTHAASFAALVEVARKRRKRLDWEKVQGGT